MTRSLHADHDATPNRPSGFAAMMREGTRRVHREAERSGFLADLIRGRATRHGYATFLRNLVPVYAALEQGLDAHAETPILATFADPRLRRLPALARDLEAIAGPDWVSSCAPVPEAEAYARAVALAARGDGRLLIAHAYARYLGDLSGGQILGPLLARTLGLGPDALGFYVFPALADLCSVKTAMRDALDAIAVTGTDSERILAEAIDAFRHNIAVSNGVQAALL